MSIFTCLRAEDTPTAAKLQRLWAHCILAKLIKDVGAWPSMSVEGRMAHGMRQSARNPSDLTMTEGAIDRLRRSLDVGLWVQSQLLGLGPLRYGISYFSYVEDLDAESIGAIIEFEPKVILGHRLATARHLNRAVKHAARQAGVVEEVV